MSKFSLGGSVGPDDEIKDKTKFLKTRQASRDSVRQVLTDKYPHDFNKVNMGMLDYYQTEKPYTPKQKLGVTTMDNKRAILSRGVDDSSHILPYKHGGKIYIKPENRGKFNATKAATGKSTEELTHSSNPVTKKRAVFAQNASKWHHGDGGPIGGPGAGPVGPGDGKPNPDFKHLSWKDQGVMDSTGRGPSMMYKTTFGAMNRFNNTAIPEGADPNDVTYTQSPTGFTDALKQALGRPGSGAISKPALDISGAPAPQAGAHARFANGGRLLSGGAPGYPDTHLGKGGTMDYPGRGHGFAPVTAFKDGGVITNAAKRALGHKLTPDNELNPGGSESGLGGRVAPGGIEAPVLMYNTGLDGREAATRALKRITPLPMGANGMKMGQRPTSYGYSLFSGLGNSNFGDKTFDPSKDGSSTRAVKLK